MHSTGDIEVYSAASRTPAETAHSLHSITLRLEICNPRQKNFLKIIQKDPLPHPLQTPVSPLKSAFLKYTFLLTKKSKLPTNITLKIMLISEIERKNVQQNMTKFVTLPPPPRALNPHQNPKFKKYFFQLNKKKNTKKRHLKSQITIVISAKKKTQIS